jgi:hypothetical protein
MLGDGTNGVGKGLDSISERKLTEPSNAWRLNPIGGRSSEFGFAAFVSGDSLMRYYCVADPDHLLILAVAHSRRRPGYWLRRERKQ